MSRVINPFFSKEKLIPVFKWFFYYLLLLFCYVLQTVPNLFELFGIKPVLVLPIALCVCMYEGVMGSAVYCMIAGLLWDISSDKLFGFNAVILIIAGALISLLCIYYLRTKLINAISFVAVVAAIQGLLDYVFYYALWGYDNPLTILTAHILPTAAYTVIVSPVLFFIVRFFASKFHQTARI